MQTQEQFKAKIEEMAARCAPKIIEEAMALVEWGQLRGHLESVEDDYRLPKIALAAALVSVAYGYMPDDTKDARLARQLMPKL